MSVIPSHAELADAVGRTFTFSSALTGAIDARLTSARAETPMDDSFLCYSAHFELPAGVRLPQDTYRVSAPGGAVWELLATPTRPAANGAGTMCIVIHCEKPRDATLPETVDAGRA